MTGAGPADLRPTAVTPVPARRLGVRLAVDVLPLDPDALPGAGTATPTTAPHHAAAPLPSAAALPAPPPTAFPGAATTPDVTHGWGAPPVDLPLDTPPAPGPAPSRVPLQAAIPPRGMPVPADVAAEVALLLATGEAWDRPDTPATAEPDVVPPTLVPPVAVPPQVRRHVELVFRDGSSTALDPDGEQALALAELSALLTGRE